MQAQSSLCSSEPSPRPGGTRSSDRSPLPLPQQSRNCYRVPIPLEPLKDGPSMDPKERLFLEAAERGDKHTMIRCLATPNPVNVNCTNILGRSAIQIAVDNENVEIVELLLQQKDVRIGDALLYAIREGVYKIVEMLINHPSITSEMLANGWAEARARTSSPDNGDDEDESFDYSPDISPVILAAHCNQFEILQLLLSRGAVIDKPHSSSCACQRCHLGMQYDSLRFSLRRIHTYRALASPAWISLTSEDPIYTAFKLSWELEKLALRENEFKEYYLELSNQCKKYSCDLLDLCRSTEEVIAVLNKETDDGSTDFHTTTPRANGLSLSRLKLALKYEQKQFVAHPNCQQLLTSIWYEGLPVWRRRNAFVKMLICISLILCLPIIAVYYLLFPRSKLSKIVRSPFMKFIYHSASFGCFLFLLVLASTRTGDSEERVRQNERGPPPSPVEWCIFFWVTGMVWSECKQLWEEGLKAYLNQWWNWLDFLMLSAYLCTLSLRAVAYIQIQSGRYGARVLERAQWPGNDPTLISEGIFAVANVFSFARIIYLFQTNPHLGPLQISLGCMIMDIAKFLFIFFLVLTSFACGLNQLYWYYDTSNAFCDTKEIAGTNITFNCHHNPDAFMTIDSSYTSLLWSVFGVIPIKDISARKDQPFTKWVGEALLAAYMIMAMTVMINMLIAMMSRSFQDIEDHADREWKFARSKLWMGYFDEGSTLPPPFNLVISPKSIYYFVRCLFQTLCWCYSCLSDLTFNCLGRPSFQHNMVKPEETSIYMQSSHVLGEQCEPPLPKDPQNPNSQPEDHPNGDANAVNAELTLLLQSKIKYQEVMKRLVSRYIHQTKKQLRQDGVNEDDLLEIKQDISSLRYELREDRKRESAQSTGQMDTLRRDIIRSVRSGPTPPVRTPSAETAPSTSTTSALNLLTQEEVDTLRNEIVQGLRKEMHDLVLEMQRHLLLHQSRAILQPPPPPLPPGVAPPTPCIGPPTASFFSSAPTGVIQRQSSAPPAFPVSDLFQTHLYTQL